MTLVERALRRLAPLFGNPRVIYDRLGVSPYLSRYYIFGGPSMPDGSDPFTNDGTVRKGAVWSSRRLGVYLHCFHRSDDDEALHSHPWEWAASLILSGGYTEERRDWDDSIIKSRFRPGCVNVLGEHSYHRVDLDSGREAWTLFVAGPKADTWYFWDRTTKVMTHWRKFINELRDATAFSKPS